MSDEFWNEGNLMALGAREIVKRHAAEVAELKAERDAAKLQYNPDDVAFTSRVPALESEIAALSAEIAQLDIENKNRTWYVTEYAIVCKERDGLRAELATAHAELDRTNISKINNLGARAAEAANEIIRRGKVFNVFFDDLKHARQQLTQLKTENAEMAKRDEILVADRTRAESAMVAAQREIAALRQPGVRVPVTWDVTAEDMYQDWRDKKHYGIRDWINWGMDYLAAHATIAVPPGLPSVEDLVLIGRNAYQKSLRFTEYATFSEMSPDGKIGDSAMTTAIRDRIVAALALRPWTDDKIEVLARVLLRAIDGISDLEGCAPEQQEKWRNVARAAVDFMRAEPPDRRITELEAALPPESRTPEQILLKSGFEMLWDEVCAEEPVATPETLEELAEIAGKYYAAHRTRDGVWEGLCAAILHAAQAYVDITDEQCMEEMLTIKKTQESPSSPKFRDLCNSRIRYRVAVPPVGWTLDVTAEELRNKLWGFFDADKLSKEVLDLCRSRIRPAFECEKCARRKELGRVDNEDLAARINAARAALEGE